MSTGRPDPISCSDAVPRCQGEPRWQLNSAAGGTKMAADSSPRPSARPSLQPIPGLGIGAVVSPGYPDPVAGIQAVLGRRGEPRCYLESAAGGTKMAAGGH